MRSKILHILILALILALFTTLTFAENKATLDEIINGFDDKKSETSGKIPRDDIQGEGSELT